MRSFLLKNEATIGRVATIIIFLALIRTISECFRLEHVSPNTLVFRQLEPFLIGALISSIACLVMTILSFYSKHKTIIAISILTVISLIIVKSFY